MLLDLDEVIEIKKDAYDNWIAADGLMNLKAPNKWHSPYGFTTMKSCDNDNGILFLAYFYLLLDYHGCLDDRDKVNFERALVNTRYVGAGGLYHRNPGRYDSLNSIDNYCGIVTGATLFGLSGHLDLIVKWGENSFWMFNNKDIGKWTWSAWRQPGDQAFYLIANGKKPNWLQLSWFKAGLRINALQDPLEKTSETLMSWTRVRTFELANEYGQIQSAGDVWKKRLHEVGGIEKVLMVYFKNRNHPVYRLAKGVMYI